MEEDTVSTVLEGLSQNKQYSGAVMAELQTVYSSLGALTSLLSTKTDILAYLVSLTTAHATLHHSVIDAKELTDELNGQVVAMQSILERLYREANTLSFKDDTLKTHLD